MHPPRRMPRGARGHPCGLGPQQPVDPAELAQAVSSLAYRPGNPLNDAVRRRGLHPEQAWPMVIRDQQQFHAMGRESRWDGFLERLEARVAEGGRAMAEIGRGGRHGAGAHSGHAMHGGHGGHGPPHGVRIPHGGHGLGPVRMPHGMPGGRHRGGPRHFGGHPMFGDSDDDSDNDYDDEYESDDEPPLFASHGAHGARTPHGGGLGGRHGGGPRRPGGRNHWLHDSDSDSDSDYEPNFREVRQRREAAAAQRRLREELAPGNNRGPGFW